MSEIISLEHVQLAMPRGQEDVARAFYSGVLGLVEEPKPANLAARGGVWFRGGALRLHLGVEPEFRPARKAHPALLVHGLAGLAARCAAAGFAPISDEPLDGFDRFYVFDPFGNRVELLEPSEDAAPSTERRSSSGMSENFRLPFRLGPADVRRYAEIRRRMLTEEPWAFSATPDDDVTLDPEQFAAMLADGQNAICAVEHATSASLIAVAGIRRMKAPKFSHRSQLWGIFVAQSLRGQGLGGSVVEAAINVARAWTGVDYVDLGVSANAPAAIHLYRRLGFREWGREPATTQVGECRFDEIYMTLTL